MASMLARRSRSLLLAAAGRVGCSRAAAMVPSRTITDDVSDAEDGSSSSTQGPTRGRIPLFQGVYKAVILGEVTQPPSELVMKNGRSIVNLMVATGGMRTQRKLNEGESVRQVHKVVVYQDRFKELVTQKIKKGQQVYVEGNMESRVFNDAVTGVVKLTREIAVRQNGSLISVFPLGFHIGFFGPGRLFLIADLDLRGVNNRTPPSPTKQARKGAPEESDPVADL